MRRPGRLVLLGHPVGHSLSPRLHDAALDACGISLRYEAIDVPPEGLDRILGELAATGAAGNITIPHKTAAVRHCSRVSALAGRVGAVNAFRTGTDGTLEGENTDVGGFAALARHVLGGLPSGAHVAVLGAGGGAAAVLAAVERWRETRVTLYNRSMARAHALAGRFSVVAAVESDAVSAVGDADIVVNATAVGMQGEDQPVPGSALRPGAAVLDLVYRPGGTPWVRAAAAAGHRSGDGLEMLVEQGALAFEFWFGMDAPRDAMRRALSRD